MLIMFTNSIFLELVLSFFLDFVGECLLSFLLICKNLHVRVRYGTLDY